MNTRIVFTKILIELAKKDKDIILLCGDVGYSYLEAFRDELPNQYINCGVAEQNMVGVAVGLALAGKKPWVYSMIHFVLFRPYEQVRTACYHNANIKMIGIEGGESYGFLGFTHNIVEDEDKQVLEKLPNIKIHTPKTSKEVEKVIHQEYKRKGPAYLRL